MAGAAQITITGNLTHDPELRYTSSGHAWAKFGVAVNERQRSDDGAWNVSAVTFFDCVAWRQLAENIAESLQRGDRVIVHGILRDNSWDTAAGERRTIKRLEASDVAPALMFNPARVTRNDRAAAPSAPAATRGAFQGPEGQDDEPPF